MYEQQYICRSLICMYFSSWSMWLDYGYADVNVIVFAMDLFFCMLNYIQGNR